MTHKTQFFCIVLLAITTLLIQVNRAYAVIANPNPISYTQPDGSKLTILLRGDEFIHWAVTSDGYTIMTNSKGTYEYATLDNSGRMVFSGIQANDPEKRDLSEKSWLTEIKKELFFNDGQIREMKDQLNLGGAPDAPLMGGFPPTGTRKLLMILANFSDTPTTYTQANFNNYMNQVNYNGTGSFRDYYIEVSYGQLTVNTTVTIWVTLPNTHDYYGPDTKWGEFAYQAVVAANSQAAVNFADYDNNMDGTVDGVAIIHQGRGQEESGNTLDIWSHSWDLSSAGYSYAQRTFDGVQVEAYTTMPERNSSGMGTIGVMCHEFCHNLGAPDFYDTDGSTGGSYSGTGYWDLMASGSWNGASGTKPAHPNAWIKTFLTWTVPGVLTTAQSKVLRNAQLYTDVVRYNTTTSNEYFLCENRQQTGFDVGIPGHGLIIYHVDGSYVSSHMWSNDINTTSHQGLYPVCATATGNPPTVYGTINSSGCPYPGTGSITTFTDITTPHSHSWAGANTNFPLSNITENTTTKEISFCFVSCSAPGDPLNLTASPISTSQISLAWSLNSNSNPVLVAYSLTPVFGTPVTGTSYSAGAIIPGGGTVLYNGTNTTYAHTGLNPSTFYYYKAWSVLPGVTYSPGLSSGASTSCGTVSSFPWNEGFENGGLIPNCWSQEQVSNSGVFWTFITGNGNIFPAAAHGGTYNACIKDATSADNKTRLITPSFNLTTVGSPQLKFWHTQAYWLGDQDQLSVYYKTSAGGVWTLLASYTSDIITWTQRTISLPNPSADYYIAFEGNAKYGYGICVDDVEVSGSCPTTVPVSVSITASANPVCQGTSVTYTATPINGGTTPVYQWKVNGANAGTNNAAFTYAPVTGDQVSCILTSNATCTTGNPAASNIISMTVTPIQAVGSISANQTICANTAPIMLSGVAPQNGTSPVYQWQSSLNNITFNNVNGATMLNYQPGILSSTLYYRQLQNASGTCGGPLPTNTVTISVNPLLPVSVSISPSGNDICAGTSVTFTPTPVNGGTPTYQWFKNSEPVGTGETYSCIPANGDLVYVVMTSSLACNSGSPATSNTVVMTVNPLLPVSVSVSPSANDICEGTSVTFTPDPVNGGTPSYQWYKNSEPVGTGETYSCIPANGDLVYVVMASSLACNTGSPAASNTVVMTVNPLLPVSVSISPSANDICAGTSVTFTPTPVNGGTPTYQWFKNAEPVGTGGTYSCIPENGDHVHVIMTSSLACNTGSPATSNTVTMTVNPLLPVSVSILPSANDICAGTSVTFTPTPVNGGTPTYQWFKNSEPVGTGETYSCIPANGDLVYVVMTSSLACKTGSPATSNTVTMTVNPLLPVSVSVSPSANDICEGTSVTFTPDPVNGGTPSYLWFKNSEPVGTGETYSCIPENGDQVHVIMTSSLACNAGNPATSNTVVMTVNPLLPVSVSVSPSANDICEGTSVTFTPDPVNGGTPSYLWFKNSEPVGTGGTYSCIPANGDLVYVVMASSPACNTGSPAASNTVVMTVNPLLPVSVSVSPSANDICEGTSVTFTPDPVNGGTPSYQWYKNSEPVGTGGTYSCIPENGDHVHVIMTSSLACNTGSPATSNTVVMRVNPLLPVSVSVSPSTNDICEGTSVTFTPDPVNGGTPSYQWFKNAEPVGTGGTYSCIPVNGDLVYVVMTSSHACNTGSPATSNTVNMTVNPLLPVSVSVSPSANDICEGTSVTFTPDPVNGGTPSYQWFKNSEPVGTGETYSCIPANDDLVYVVMTSSLACNTGSPATSNTVAMTVNPLLPVSVSVSSSANDICEGTSVTFTPDPFNGGTPSYQWFKNSEPVGTGETYSCIPANGDLVYVVMTSSLTCKTGSPATSNTVTMTVNPLLPVSVSIVPDANPADEGTLVTFLALAVNGGTFPSYQWMVNGEANGTDNPAFVYIPANGDEITCVLTSNEICSTGNPAVSNPVVMEVNAIPSEMSLQNLAIDDIRCFNAKQTITVAGNGTVFTVLNGGSATMIAGHSIEYLPGTVVDAGGYLNGFITTNGQYCVKQAAPMVSAVTIEEEVPSSEMNLHMNIYPNPTDGNFTLEFSGIEKSEKTRLNIYGMRGDKIISMDFTGEIKGEFSLSGQPSGIYLIQIISGNGTANSRIIKR